MGAENGSRKCPLPSLPRILSLPRPPRMRSFPMPPSIDPARALVETEQFWTRWCGACTVKGSWSPLVRRSLITLKALTYAPTGGIVAAEEHLIHGGLGARVAVPWGGAPPGREME